MTFPLFDLHCDTAYEMEKKGQNLQENDLAVSLSAAKEISPYVQVMAIWTPQILSDQEGWMAFQKVHKHLAEDPAVSGKLVNFGAPYDQSRPTLLLAIEDGRIVCDDLSRLNTLHALGVRIFTPFWVDENRFGGAHNTDKGLSGFGKAALQKALRLGMILDISHASVPSAREILALAKEADRPVIASHSNAYEICNASRNLHREELDAIVACGGLVGLNLHRPFVKDDGAKLEDLLRHIDYFLERGAENCMALGGDLDGCIPLDGIKTVNDYQKLWDLLLKKGYSLSFVKNLFFGNAKNFAERYLS